MNLLFISDIHSFPLFIINEHLVYVYFARQGLQPRPATKLSPPAPALLTVNIVHVQN
ncbi:Uncharacterized protein dnm_004800 [Desulfonema magnum]|uniref:Uncharacterized protein n=1 Tax=Desulfonema magnum TaxID=45655 RepID=A0A975BFS4_9BACT|nr:Uncharacterized protein dnm_004800 [Desulfonema magnum]